MINNSQVSKTGSKADVSAPDSLTATAPMLRRSGATTDLLSVKKSSDLEIPPTKVSKLSSESIDADKAKVATTSTSEGIMDKIKRFLGISQTVLPLETVITSSAPVKVPAGIMKLLTSDKPSDNATGKEMLKDFQGMVPSGITKLIQSDNHDDFALGVKKLVSYEAKKDQLMGEVREVKTQKDMSKDLTSNSIGPFLAGFGRIDTSDTSKLEGPDKEKAVQFKAKLTEAMSRANELSIEKGVLKSTDTGKDIHISEGDIKLLLNSPKESDKKLGREALQTICDICSHPKVLSAAIEKSGMAPSSASLKEGSLESIQAQTSFIKWSRNIVTKTYFSTEIASKLDAAIAGIPQDSKLTGIKKEERSVFNKQFPPDTAMPKINDYVANVGFNRLMSENNFLGASLSSDVDFKLVFDDEKFKTDFKAQNQHLLGKGGVNEFTLDKMADQAARKAQELMVSTLKEQKASVFEGQFKLTLEVADFTVKNLSTLKVEAKSNPVEQNFLATVMHNSTFMGGNPEVLRSFKNVIDTNLGGIPLNWRDTVSPPTTLSARQNEDHRVSVTNKLVDLIMTSKAPSGGSSLKDLVINVIDSRQLKDGIKDVKITPENKDDIERFNKEIQKLDLNNDKQISAFLKNPENLKFIVQIVGDPHNAASVALGKALEDKLPEVNKKGLADRNYQQNIGNSDKGSMVAIEHLDEIETVIKTTVKAIVDTPKFLNTAKAGVLEAIAKEKGKPEQPITEYLAKHPEIDLTNLDKGTMSQLLTECPIALKNAVHHEHLNVDLLNNPAVKSAVKDGFGMFDNMNDKLGKKLDLAIGLAKTFTKYDDDGTLNRSFIGSKNTQPTDNWVYSVKFSGCRLNDMFDMVPKSVYQSAFPPDKRDEATRRFEDSQTVAGALNSFAVQIQDRTYEHFSQDRPVVTKNPDGSTTPVLETDEHGITRPKIVKALEHTEMDTKYDRITANEFVDQVTSPDKNKLKSFQSMINTLSDDLAKLPHDSPLREKMKDQIAVIESVKANVVEGITPENAKVQGYALFKALSDMALISAKHIEIK